MASASRMTRWGGPGLTIESLREEAMHNMSPEGTYPPPPLYFHDALEDAERLLKDAAESGIEIDEDTRDHVLQARSVVGLGWDQKPAANLLAALAKQAARLKPVTAESLKAFSDNTLHTVGTYGI